MEGSLVAYKVFTNGSTLQASEINENLMQQSTAVFSNAAARTAAITSPVEGQLTYLEDVDRYDHWDGSAWVSPFGLTLLNRTAFSAAGSVSLNNLFSAAYDDYRIMITITGSSAGGGINVRLRAGGVDNSSANYYNNRMYAYLTTVASEGAGAETAFGATLERSAGNSVGAYDFFMPFATNITSMVGLNTFLYGTAQHTSFKSGQTTVTTSYDGFTLFPNSGTITGNLEVYGYRK
jgi:hypothetical protein